MADVAYSTRLGIIVSITLRYRSSLSQYRSNIIVVQRSIITRFIVSPHISVCSVQFHVSNLTFISGTDSCRFHNCRINNKYNNSRITNGIILLSSFVIIQQRISEAIGRPIKTRPIIKALRSTEFRH